MSSGLGGLVCIGQIAYYIGSRVLKTTTNAKYALKKVKCFAHFTATALKIISNL